MFHQQVLRSTQSLLPHRPLSRTMIGTESTASSLAFFAFSIKYLIIKRKQEKNTYVRNNNNNKEN